MSEDLKSFILEHGLTMSAMLSALFLLSWTIKPQIWKVEHEDLPPNSAYRLYYALLFLTMFWYFIYANLELIELTVSPVPQTTLFFINLSLLGLYVVFDLIIVDLLLMRKLGNSFASKANFSIRKDFTFHLTYAGRMCIFGGVIAFVASQVAAHL